MKFFLLIPLCLVGITATAQKKIRANLRLVYPTKLTYDTILVRNSDREVLSETSTTLKDGERINTYLINTDSTTEDDFSIYFGGSLSAVNDTLYFASHGRDLLIELKDSFALRDRINFKLKNVYNFESLYKRYNQYCSSQMHKYDSLIKSNSDYPFSKQQYYLNVGFDFVKKNLNNPYSVDLFAVFVINPPLFYVGYKEANQFYTNYLKPAIKDSGVRRFVETKIDNLKKSLTEGAMAPTFSARSIHNKIVSSASLSGKNFLLVFWATWCGPCMAELPYLKQIYKEYNEDNFVMISVSLDRDSLKMANTVIEKKLNWLQIYNNQALVESYKINRIPAMFLIDENGRILFNSVSITEGTDNAELLKSLLKQKFKH